MSITVNTHSRCLGYRKQTTFKFTPFIFRRTVVTSKTDVDERVCADVGLYAAE